MTAQALFRFTGPNMTQYACVKKDEAWAIQSEREFLDANGSSALTARLWEGLPYVPKPMEDCPQLESFLAKVREYMEEERHVLEKIETYKKQGVLADETELLARAAETYGRITSMYLAEAVRFFKARRHPVKFMLAGGC